MNIEHLKVTLETIAGAEEVLALSATPRFLWDKEQKKKLDKRDGSDVTVVATENSYEKFKVHVLLPCEKLFESGAPIPCTFEGFEAKLYRNFQTNEYSITCTADKLIPLK